MRVVDAPYQAAPLQGLHLAGDVRPGQLDAVGDLADAQGAVRAAQGQEDGDRWAVLAQARRLGGLFDDAPLGQGVAEVCDARQGC
ncbi:hypothetical protein EES43_10995 [Streptomyces sp. ADI96-02]|nr:hypothetical protein EES43_10995 [Streptomyces sp. ADI96-02]